MTAHNCQKCCGLFTPFSKVPCCNPATAYHMLKQMIMPISISYLYTDVKIECFEITLCFVSWFTFLCKTTALHVTL